MSSYYVEDDEYLWPAFTIEGMVDGCTEVRCSDCDWAKVFDPRVSYDVLATALTRHGMGHKEEQR